jgi:hypothetical protein
VNQSNVAWGTAELYDPATNAWAAAAPMLTIQGPDLQAVRLDDGRVLAIQGLNAEIYDPAADAWSMTGAPTVGRLSFTATRLADGRVLITGGYASEPPFDSVYSSAEVYSPMTGVFTLVGPMSAARLGHVAALLPDGRVLVAGGRDADQGTSSAELFDPSSNAFQPAPSMFAARWNAAATTLANGDVLVTGGAGGQPMMPEILSSAERYDPIADVWKPWGSMQTARAYHTLAPLPDGRALVAGGYMGSVVGDDFSYQETAELSGDPEGGNGGSGGAAGNGGGGGGGNGGNGNEGGAGGEGAASSSGGPNAGGSSATGSSSMTASGGAPEDPSDEGCSVADGPRRESPRSWALLSFVAAFAALVRRRSRLASGLCCRRRE